ncbi:MAG: hypothetical protein ACYCTH_09900 [Cellulomonas sp.]
MSDSIPRQISGGSSYVWSRRLIVVLLSTMALGLVMAAFVLAQARTVFSAVLPFWLVLCALSVLGIALEATQDVRESRAGYTTLFGVRRDKMQLNPYTGEVIRGAGEAMLARKEFLRIVRESRDLQRHQSR